jgi:uncharacterized protein YacL
MATNNRTLMPIRVVFVAVCAAAGLLVCYTVREWDEYRLKATLVGLGIGVLVVLVDIMLRGFSLRGLSAITFGLGVGTVISYLIGNSPLFRDGDMQIIFLVRLALFIISTYLCTVIALRGKDEFNLVIPYVRFVPHEVEVPLLVVDSSALIDGRIARVCETGFISAALVIPSFVLDELRFVAESSDVYRQARGRRGLEVLAALRKLPHLDLRIQTSEVEKREDIAAKLVFVAQAMKARLLTTDYNLAKLAEFHGVGWMNLNTLAKALKPELVLGEVLEIQVMKVGKEEGQGVGFLEDGSMVVVSGARERIGQMVTVEIMSVLPSSAGKMVFARLLDA